MRGAPTDQVFLMSRHYDHGAEGPNYRLDGPHVSDIAGVAQPLPTLHAHPAVAWEPQAYDSK